MKKPAFFGKALNEGSAYLALAGVTDDWSGVCYQEYHVVKGEDTVTALLFLFNTMSPKKDKQYPFQGIPSVIYPPLPDAGFDKGGNHRHKTVDVEIIEAVLSPDLNTLEPKLARHGYNTTALCEHLNARRNEIKAYFNGQLPAPRADEFN